MKKKKINILSPGRFHVCDLARELNMQGFDVKFYSFVPTKRAEKFGLPVSCSCSLFWILSPLLFLERYVFKGKEWMRYTRIVCQDYFTGWLMRKCDVCIAMSGSFVYAPQKAKKNGAIVILERGSKHILEQKKILESIPANSMKKPVPNKNVERELDGYIFADYIAIATQHVKRSFDKQNYPEEKLFINPYGVDLSMFRPLHGIEKKYDIIMVGAWSYRKGCDLIIDAIRRTQLTLLHVGGIVDLSFPDEQNFTHIDPVDQAQLIKYYNQAKIFLLPSREEGLAMVQAQAIACNLPLIGSPDSGAEDLKGIVAKPEYITIVKEYTVEAVCDAIYETIANYKHLGDELYAGDAIQNLTWEAYGKRYAEFLNSVVKERIDQC